MMSELQSKLWAEPIEVTDPAQCRFYHTIELPDGEVQDGDWDLRGREADYSGHVDLSGKRVIDLGTASGFMSFAFEGMGASEVVSADVASADQYTKVPYADEDWSPGSRMRLSAETGLERMKRSYWYSHGKLASQARVHYGDLHKLAEDLGRFDVGFIGQIMVHNRDPLGLLESVARLVDDTLIISEGMIEKDEPIARFFPDPKRRPRPHGWLRFSTGALKSFLDVIGFETTSQETQEYTNVVHGVSSPITTLVARRR